MLRREHRLVGQPDGSTNLSLRDYFQHFTSQKWEYLTILSYAIAARHLPRQSKNSMTIILPFVTTALFNRKGQPACQCGEFFPKEAGTPRNEGESQKSKLEFVDASLFEAFHLIFH